MIVKGSGIHPSDCASVRSRQPNRLEERIQLSSLFSSSKTGKPCCALRIPFVKLQPRAEIASHMLRYKEAILHVMPGGLQDVLLRRKLRRRQALLAEPDAHRLLTPRTLLRTSWFCGRGLPTVKGRRRQFQDPARTRTNCPSPQAADRRDVGTPICSPAAIGVQPWAFWAPARAYRAFLELASALYLDQEWEE